jgi:hypothetical protein
MSMYITLLFPKIEDTNIITTLIISKNKLNFIYLVTRVHLMGGPLLKPLALFAQVDIVCCLRSWTTVDTCRYS